MKVQLTVVFPVEVEIDVDVTKLNDDDYICQKRDEAKNIASKIIEPSTIKPIIHNADCSACSDLIDSYLLID